MDFIKLKSGIKEWLGKYKYVWVVLVIGMILMVLPEQKDFNEKKDLQEDTIQLDDISVQEQLEAILMQLDGAGRVQVLLTIAMGERTIYQTDSTYSQSENHTDSKTQTILITDSQRNENGLVHQKNPPVYQGAVILAEGAESPSVKLAIVEAVSDATGLGTDKITVLKMK